MKPKDWFKKNLEKFENDPHYLAEVLQLDVSEQIIHILEENGMKRSDLADKLRCSSAYISKLLNDTQNLTLKKMVEISHAIDCSVDIAFIPTQYQMRRSFVYVPPKFTNNKFTETVELTKADESNSPIAA